ncbi:MAG: HAMP domain-containing histidine kinase, partial [Bacteroidia bacterium]|nr:HAMP domain-containing histidine kinase [Bacteroidia bacterium]
MNIYARKQRWKIFLLITAVIISVSSLWYTNNLVNKLRAQEQKKVELWAEGTRQLSDISVESGDISFALEVIRNNTTVPVILTDDENRIISTRNLDSIQSTNQKYVEKQLEIMESQRPPIEIAFANNQKNFIYYKDSYLLTQLKYYPIFQLAVIGLFLFVSYLAFSSSRKAEQNQVWVGMAKETAHQLGTPLSSLVAWLEYLKMKGQQDQHLSEIEKDIDRLRTITERFSKIGAAPSLHKENILDVIQESINYIKKRSSAKVIFELSSMEDTDVHAPINIPLFEWVLENIFKNAIDAISGAGNINILVTDQQQFV